MTLSPPDSSDDLSVGQVDGVVTLSLAAGALPGPLRACLMFGVGRIDEDLPTAGITHLVEHLSLANIDGITCPWNGQVSSVSTRFMVAGDPDQVSRFLTTVSQHLRELDIDRFSDELRILEIESSRRQLSQLEQDLGFRYGPRGAGLLGWPQHGLKRLTSDEVQSWASERFVAQNAILWVSGPIPEGLTLAGLPTGERVSRSENPPLLTRQRTFRRLKSNSVSLSLLSTSAGYGTMVGMLIARQRAHERLRLREAVSYSVELARVRTGGGHGLEYLSADGADESGSIIFSELSRVIDELATVGPTSDELGTVRSQFRQAQADPSSMAGGMDGIAERYLLGRPFKRLEGWRTELDSLTSEEVRGALAEELSTLFAIAPHGLEGVPENWSELESWSGSRVDGTTHLSIAGRERGKLVVGSEGVSWIQDAEHFQTVLWVDAAACFSWDDGQRVLVGQDNRRVVVTPTKWQGGSELAAVIDSALAAGLRIPMGEGGGSGVANADIRWLATVVGVLEKGGRVDVVVRTDGLLLLPGMPTHGNITQLRLDLLKNMDPQKALTEERGSRWIPVEDIANARRFKKRFSPSALWVEITLATAKKSLEFDLRTLKVARTFDSGMRNLLGSRYQGPPTSEPT